MMDANTLDFLKAQLAQVNAQIAPLNILSITLKQQINKLETDAKLAEYGLAVSDALHLLNECISHNRMRAAEIADIPSSTLYISGLNYGQVLLSKYPDGGGVAYAAEFDMAQRMKAAYAELQRRQEVR